MSDTEISTRELAELPELGLRLLESARAQLSAAEAYLAQPGNKRHSGIHQARKCLRRTRALLALGDKRFRGSAEALDTDLGRICRGLSVLRDAQALVETLKRLGKSAPESLSILPEALAAARARRDSLLVRSLIRDTDMRSRRLRIHTMRERLSGLDWQRLSEKSVRRALGRSAKRVAKAGKRAKKCAPQHDAWHIYRRRLRRWHQQQTVLTGLAPELFEQSEEIIERANALGSAQDDVLLLARCGSRSPFTAAQRVVLRKIARARLADSRSKS